MKKCILLTVFFLATLTSFSQKRHHYVGARQARSHVGFYRPTTSKKHESASKIIAHRISQKPVVRRKK